jgi:hypothetical protein
MSLLAPSKPKNYLNNKDILKEIHESKNTYCSYVDSTSHRYDFIVDLPQEPVEKGLQYAGKSETLLEARENRANRINQETNQKLTADDIPVTDLVFRIMTWDHIPVAPKQPRKVTKKKTAKDIFEFDNDTDEAFSDLEDVSTRDEIDDMVHVKVNFPPFQHFKIDDNNTFYCIGKSHWLGDLETGEFSKDHGNITNKLAKMYMMLCEKYAMKYNWRGYCVDAETQALTDTGWVDINSITTNHTILSYNGTNLAWSAVKSIYRGDFSGKMFKLSSRGIDSLITPGHKIVTKNGLVPIELLKQSDQVIIMADSVDAPSPIYSDNLVELVGWIVANGQYDLDQSGIKSITIYQNPGVKADRIRNCLQRLELKFTEVADKNIAFRIEESDSQHITKLIPNKNLTMEFILSLSQGQKILLVENMIDGAGWRRCGRRGYTEKSLSGIEMFQALCTLSGIRTSTEPVTNSINYGKSVEYYNVNLYHDRGNTARGEYIDLHGGKNSGKSHPGLGKITHPNIPTEPYVGKVWCPETEFGCFMAKRNGKIYLTGNTYNDEMKASAILQLTYVGLRFNEAKSANPFAYYTAAITNSFCRVLNTEKKNQNIRDDILEMNNLAPSWSRQGTGGSGTYDE